MVSLLVRLFRRIEQSYSKNKIHFSTKIAKKTSYIGHGVKIYNPNVILEEGVIVYDNAIFWGDGTIVIKKGAKIGFNTIIYSSARGGVEVGERTAIAANCYVIDTNHSSGMITRLSTDGDVSEKIIIGNDVLVYSGCIIGKGSHLKDRSVIACNSFVNNEVPEDSIAAGSPAVIKKYRG